MAVQVRVRRPFSGEPARGRPAQNGACLEGTRHRHGRAAPASATSRGGSSPRVATRGTSAFRGGSGAGGRCAGRCTTWPPPARPPCSSSMRWPGSHRGRCPARPCRPARPVLRRVRRCGARRWWAWPIWGGGPTRLQQTALQWLYPSCANQACSAQARLDYDHRPDWSRTHFTVLDLLDRLCGHCHALKTRNNWSLVEGRGKRALVPPEDPRHPENGAGKPPRPPPARC